jgi:hypothetical protein
MILFILTFFPLSALGRRQRRSTWKAVLRAEAAALAIAFGGLCYIADNNRVELPEAGTNHPD